MSDSLAPWRVALSRALHLNRSQPYSRYFQLATITPEGFPKNRTVVFRGYLDNTNQIKIVTDLRSEKVNQINYQPWGEICWYFTKTREQFRLSGRLTLITPNYPDSTLQKERQLAWQQLSDSARLQFTWPEPGQLRIEDNSAFSAASPAPEHPLEHFCLLLLDPEKVDHLELRGNPQNRCQYYLDESKNWIAQSINP
ncbi:Npun_F5749 family FMN-dependent PPOX-type flavoprotein [Gloeothece citriformis]|nr:Npun_F5749 family FMN-dependent PPOX-type flavoprotein [Gloeothece citriformis]